MNLDALRAEVLKAIGEQVQDRRRKKQLLAEANKLLDRKRVRGWGAFQGRLIHLTYLLGSADVDLSPKAVQRINELCKMREEPDIL